VGGALAAVVAAIGAMHMPFARDWLMSVGGCPVGHAPLAELEPARRAAMQSEKGVDAAPARPALGFELDKTTRADQRMWTDRSNVSCDEVREGLVLCKDVPSAALGLPEADGPVSELHLGFDTRGILVDIATMRMHTSASHVQDIESRLEAQIGGPHQKSGSFDPVHLALSGAESLSSVRYRYNDYFAEVIAMRFQVDGLVLREHYASVND
jgi:hypothetical protein